MAILIAAGDTPKQSDGEELLAPQPSGEDIVLVPVGIARLRICLHPDGRYTASIENASLYVRNWFPVSYVLVDLRTASSQRDSLFFSQWGFRPDCVGL